MTPDGLGGFLWNNGSEGLRRCLLHVAQATEVGEQTLTGLRTYTGDIEKLRVTVAHRAPLPVIADCEAVAFVADELNEMENR